MQFLAVLAFVRVKTRAQRGTYLRHGCSAHRFVPQATTTQDNNHIVTHRAGGTSLCERVF